MRWVTGAALDLGCVAAFVGIGRASHAEPGTVTGLAATGWPFLAGTVIAWAATRAWRRPAAVVPTGTVVWLMTVAVGMALRVLSGQGTAVTFVVVAAAFLAATMLGWRAARTVAVRARGRVSVRAFDRS